MMITLSAVRRIAADHPSFAGHFPGQPVLPGALLLAEVLEALREAAVPIGDACTLRTAKFLWPVRPDDELRIELRIADTHARFEVHCGPRLAASGQFAWPAAAP